MSGRARAYDRWRDAQGIHVPVGACIEQAGTDARMGALRSRLGRRGEVIGRGTTRLVVRFGLPVTERVTGDALTVLHTVVFDWPE